MERAHLQLSYPDLTQELRQSLSHLVRSFVRERDSTYCRGWDMTIQNKMGDPRGKNLDRVNTLGKAEPMVHHTLVFPLPGLARICRVELGGCVAAIRWDSDLEPKSRLMNDERTLELDTIQCIKERVGSLHLLLPMGLWGKPLAQGCS